MVKKYDLNEAFIFLDEVGFTKDWWRAIKYLIDTGELLNTVTTVTSSVSIKFKGEIELFPGRRGYGETVVAYPLSFREYISVLKPELNGKIVSTKSMDELRNVIELNMRYYSELKILFEKYLETGGFPLTIREFYSTKNVSYKTVENYLIWIENDILKAGRSTDLARQIIGTLLEKIPSTVSYDTIARQTDARSHKTVAAYINLFKNMYILDILYAYDPSRRTEQYRKEKKIFLTDPLLFKIFSYWCLREYNYSALLENTVQSHLKRIYGDRVYYFKNRYEIDAVVFEGSKAYGVEVKTTKTKYRFKPRWIKEIYILGENEIPIPVFLASLP